MSDFDSWLDLELDLHRSKIENAFGGKQLHNRKCNSETEETRRFQKVTTTLNNNKQHKNGGF